METTRLPKIRRSGFFANSTYEIIARSRDAIAGSLARKLEAMGYTAIDLGDRYSKVRPVQSRAAHGPMARCLQP